MPWCGCVEYGLEHFSFYVQKHIAHLVACSGPPPPLVSDGPLRAPAFLKLTYHIHRWLFMLEMIVDITIFIVVPLLALFDIM